MERESRNTATSSEEGQRVFRVLQTSSEICSYLQENGSKIKDLKQRNCCDCMMVNSLERVVKIGGRVTF